MPTYEFRCPQGHEFEKFYRTIGTAEAQAACPTCGAPSERRMSATGFAFKGSGFYLTDYGKNAHREKGTPSPASPASGEGGKAESGKAEGGASEKAAPAGGGDAPAKPAAAESKPAAAPAKKSSTE